jgi:hypothetical protein
MYRIKKRREIYIPTFNLEASYFNRSVATETVHHSLLFYLPTILCHHPPTLSWSNSPPFFYFQDLANIFVITFQNTLHDRFS